jgi:hypothetical protein
MTAEQEIKRMQSIVTSGKVLHTPEDRDFPEGVRTERPRNSGGDTCRDREHLDTLVAALPG